MNCSKCNQPMKEYHGLFEKGWDCTNANCGKINNFYSEADGDYYSMDSYGNETPLGIPPGTKFGANLPPDNRDFSNIKPPTQVPPYPTDEDVVELIESLQENLNKAFGVSPDEVQPPSVDGNTKLKDDLDRDLYPLSGVDFAQSSDVIDAIRYTYSYTWTPKTAVGENLNKIAEQMGIERTFAEWIPSNLNYKLTKPGEK